MISPEEKNIPHIYMKKIEKRFGNLYALSEVNFLVKKGEIHALVGENGAGKSTLMNILYGIHKANSGEIFIDGIEKKFKTPRDAIKAGIGMVHQHFSVIPVFKVEEDIILGNENIRRKIFLDLNKTRNEIRKIFSLLGTDINPDTLIKNLSVGQQQKVEIAKVLYRGAKILILDEPTSVLTPQESIIFFDTLRRLNSEGLTIIIITHKLDEVKAVSHRLTALRDGKIMGTRNTEDVSAEEIADMMVGRNFLIKTSKHFYFKPDEINDKKRILEIKNLTTASQSHKVNLSDVNLSVYPGEILGIAGIDGNGQNELAKTLLGLNEDWSGDILFKGVSIKNKNTSQIMSLGISHIPSDRIKHGLIEDMDFTENLLPGNLENKEYSGFLFLKMKNIRKKARTYINDFDIKPPEIKLKAKNFSGGNQQKIIIARELSRKADLIIAMQPTRGVDVGAIEFINERLIEEQKKGKAILLISTELSEILALSDYISVIYKGKITPPKIRAELDEHKIGLLMMGKGIE